MTRTEKNILILKWIIFITVILLRFAQVVETSVTVTNSSFQNYTHPNDHAIQNTKILLNALSF